MIGRPQTAIGHQLVAVSCQHKVLPVEFLIHTGEEKNMTSLKDIEDVSQSEMVRSAAAEGFAARFAAAGVTTTEGLLERAATPKGREELTAATGVDHSVILRLANHADLFRIRGIATQYADLLEAAGVDTVPELAQRNPENLVKKLAEVNEAQGLVKRLPTLTEVTDWIAQAKELPRAIHY